MPKQNQSPVQKYTFEDFNRDFPTDDACLEWLRQYLYPDGIYCPKCGRVTKHHRVLSRPSYSCQFCGHHVHPTADTIFHKSSTSLKTWFHAIYLMASTRCGISAKQLEREIGVSYPTALRMFRQIRSLLGQDGDPVFSGTVEMDGAYIGGRGQWRHGPTKSGAPRADDPHKTHVFGIVQRGS